MSSPEVAIQLALIAISFSLVALISFGIQVFHLTRNRRRARESLKPPVHSVMIYVGPGSSITGYRIRQDNDPSHDIVKNHVQVYASPGTYNIALTLEES